MNMNDLVNKLWIFSNKYWLGGVLKKNPHCLFCSMVWQFVQRVPHRTSHTRSPTEETREIKMRLGAKWLIRVANNKDASKYYLIAQQGPVQPAVSWKYEILNDFCFKLDKEGWGPFNTWVLFERGVGQVGDGQWQNQEESGGVLTLPNCGTFSKN